MPDGQAMVTHIPVAWSSELSHGHFVTTHISTFFCLAAGLLLFGLLSGCNEVDAARCHENTQHALRQLHYWDNDLPATAGLPL